MKIITTLIRGTMRQGIDIRILVRNNNVDSALRVLKRKTKDKLVELKDKGYHEKRVHKKNDKQLRNRDNNKKEKGRLDRTYLDT